VNDPDQLVVLSMILTAAVPFPDIGDATILWTLGSGLVLALIAGGFGFVGPRGDVDEPPVTGYDWPG
jgi:hypothetical protein